MGFDGAFDFSLGLENPHTIDLELEGLPLGLDLGEFRLIAVIDLTFIAIVNVPLQC